MASSDTPPRLIPDEVFSNSPLLQELQRRGLYDQTSPKNAWPELPRFQLVPESLIVELGTWAEAFVCGNRFQEKVKPHNEIRLPHPIALGILTEGRGINEPIEPYRKYIRAALEMMVKRAGEESAAAAGSEPFERHLCGYLANFMRTIAPKVCSGEFPLSSLAPGFKRAAPKSKSLTRISLVTPVH